MSSQSTCVSIRTLHSRRQSTGGASLSNLTIQASIDGKDRRRVNARPPKQQSQIDVESKVQAQLTSMSNGKQQAENCLKACQGARSSASGEDAEDIVAAHLGDGHRKIFKGNDETAPRREVLFVLPMSNYCEGE